MYQWSDCSSCNTIAFESKADHPQIRYTGTLFWYCDLDLDLMTLIYELDLDILKMYLCTKIKFLGQGFRKLEPN